LKNAKNYFIETKIHKLTESVIPNSVSTSTWLCVAYHLTQCFPTFLISRPQLKILYKRLAPEITCNSEGVEMTTNKIKKSPSFHMLYALHLHCYAKERVHIL